MPGCSNRNRRITAVPVLLAAIGLTACGGQAQGGRFEVHAVDASWSNGRMEVSFEQALSLSPEARNALVHGVPLTLALELVLRDAKTQTRLKKHRAQYEIRYLPLSEHYQLSRPGSDASQTFPRLRHALAELGSLELEVETGALPRGEYELLTRSFLDKQEMPPPMRLPVLFSPRWSHESEWTSWPLNIEPGA